MPNVLSDKPSSGIQHFNFSDLSATERIVFWSIVLTPVWWLLGIQPLFYPAVAIALFVASFDLDKITKGSLPVCVWAWLAMALVMLWTATIGLHSMGFPLKETIAGAVTFLKSYFFIFACLVLPFWTKLRTHVITRATAVMAISYLIATAIQMVLLVVGIRDTAYAPLLARLVPGEKSSLMIVLASIQPFFGIPLPRTVLYTPDPPILGICGVLCFLICLGETNRQLRNWALAGSLCALIVSFSRLAWICLPLALLIIVCFQSQIIQEIYLWLASLTFLICSFLGLTVGDLVDKPMEIFDSARAESSKVRALVVSKTLEAWQEKPWLGWGVISGSVNVYDNEYVTLASFSSYAAVLYLHGIVGLIVLIFALIVTLFAFYTPSVRGSILSKRAFACLIVLYIQMNSIPLSWVAISIWFFFLWLGAVLQETHSNRSTIFNWEQLVM
ncbi:O-antigen ligase domain-containing protein [Scytonema sp. UIC 10036]|uniref:O-antigen ligase family protein n=1 Tax=Scytonema sp. UIC 10036 TaxID=2304196 RepID=UPI0012DA2E7F|nr:O-antigen ligase family protein [Scytonema sp. UIC 10036]MUH00469.1 O-antigen ligase domain-containing protein [Scytonema sp. UIC 10036]